MKKVLLAMIALVAMAGAANAQIRVLQVEQKEKVVKPIFPYDSLQSINEKNFMAHIGQELFVVENYEASKRGFYNFCTKPTYFETEARFAKLEDYNAIKGKYFLVDTITTHNITNEDIIKLKEKYPRHRFASISRDIDLFEKEQTVHLMRLIERTSNDTIYFRVYERENAKPFEASNSYGLFKYFLTVGFYEKLKSIYAGKIYITQIDVYRFSSLKNLRPDTPLPKGTKLQCIDLSFAKLSDKEEEVAKMVAVFKYNEEEVVVDIERMKHTNIFESYDFKMGRYRYVNHSWSTPILKSISDIERERTEKNKLIRKYGQANANLIVKGKLKLGFSREMCIESWGEPNNINTTTGQYGRHEQWVYGNSYLYFKNGLLSDIQD